MTIASEITRIKTNIENTYAKAEEKGATMPEVLNSDALAECIESIPKGEGGGSEIPKGKYRIRFFDYDGTVLSEQILDEGSTITAPDIPQHDGLEFSDWNIKFDSPVTCHKDIGAIYMPVNNDTRIKILLTEETGLTFDFEVCGFTLKKSSDYNIEGYIDFGDGEREELNTTVKANTTQSYSGVSYTLTHTYPAYGEYTIILSSDVILEESPSTSNRYLKSYWFKFGNKTYKEIIEMNFGYMQTINMSNALNWSGPAFVSLSKISFYGDDGDIKFLLQYSKISHINVPSGVEFANENMDSLKTISLPFPSGSSLKNCKNIEEFVLNPITGDKTFRIDDISSCYNLKNIYNIDKDNVFISSKWSSSPNLYIDTVTFPGAYEGLNFSEDITILSSNSFGTTTTLTTSYKTKNITFNLANKSSYVLSKQRGISVKDFIYLENIDIEGDYLFESESNMFTIKLENCTSLKELDISKLCKDNIYGLNIMFKNNSSLTNIIFPKNVQALYLDNYAFSGCILMEYIDLSEHNLLPYGSSSSINNMFANNTSLKYILLPDVFPSVSVSSMYYNCILLETGVLPEGIKELNGSVFYSCKSLKEVVLPNSITKISGSQNFYNCTSLEKVWIPSSIETIQASSYSYSLFYSANPDVIIYTDATEKPSGWSQYWNYITSNTQAKVYWGATKENYENGDPIPA